MKALKALFVTGTVALLAACSAEESVTQCTTAAESEWQDQAEFQSALEAQGYDINEFKVTGGNCYEIYGHNEAGEKVEIYFNPVDGSIVKEEKE